MPVTARLSRRFYEKFGDEIVNELVEWLNQVDATYRSELREINDVNFARFVAKLDQGIAELRGEVRAELQALRGELQALRGELQVLKAEMQVLKADMQALKGDVQGLKTEQNGLRVEMQALKAELIKWMFLFWAGTALAGLLLR